MSLLGKLFSATAGPSSRPESSLDSNLEDQFTHNLLFPDAEELRHNDQVFALSSATVLPTSVNEFDLNGEIDLEMRDVRVIIMQESTPTSGSAYLLFDSNPSLPAIPGLDRQVPSPGSGYPSREGRRSISSPRKGSVGQTSRPLVIQQETSQRVFGGGAFDRRSQHVKGGPSFSETDGQKSARESREEVNTFSTCIFGSSDILAYKGTGTKLHILPAESKSFTAGSYMGDGSFGRSSIRSSRLAQSFTSENVGNGSTSTNFLNPATQSKGNERRRVLITRMFPVPLPNVEADTILNFSPTVPAHSLDGPGYPFPTIEDDIDAKPPKPQQKRTPMYAVGLIVSLPASPHPSLAPGSRSSFQSPGSYNEQDSFPSSFNSSRRAGWTMLGHGFGVESLDSSFSSDVDDRLDIVTQHWDIIMRTLSHLQTATTAALLPLLKRSDLSSPDPRTHTRAASVSISGKRVNDAFKPPKSNAKMVQLAPNALNSNQVIQKEVESARQRIVNGLKAVQVVTCQGRWGIWREEARTVGKWAGGKDQGFFFFNLLTGFLGNHVEWLQALGPSWYRQRHSQQHRAARDEDTSIPARTIILSDNKQMARRLIFLLSTFLPAAYQQLPSARLHRPSTSVSFGGYSQSPPNYAVPILREESLRRRINKRSSIARVSHSRTSSFPAQAARPLEIHHHHRRESDVVPIKTANLPIPGSDIMTRKSSTATTSTATPITTIPHFSSRRPIRGTGPAPRPGSSGSLATDDLLRSLKRGDSTGHHSTASSDSQGQNSRWGSMISGFWGSKRRDSTATSSPPKFDGLEINDPKCTNRQPSKNTLADMVQEVNKPLFQLPHYEGREIRKSDTDSAATARVNFDDGGEHVIEHAIQIPERIPDPSGAYESPVKTSIDSVNGIIDIDVPLPEYLSFETAVSSPSSSAHSFSTPGFGHGLEGFEHFSRAGPEQDTSMNVGGWLPQYNPDFVLQAIPKPVDDAYLDEIKASLKAEPTPCLASTPQADNSDVGRWINVASAVVADTTNFTIKHLRCRRLIKTVNTNHLITPMTDSKYGNVYNVTQVTPNPDMYDNIEEQIIEEHIISFDGNLIHAVERIIEQSGANSSACSSRSNSRKAAVGRERSNSEARDANHLEVPRNECKTKILTALEEIVRSVVDSREKEGSLPQEVDAATRIGGTERERESFLREGVRAWLGSVEVSE